MNTICFGEILWDILPQEKVPGGAPMNVCYHLNQLGQAAAIISKIGKDENGQGLFDFLQQHKVDVSLVQTDEQHATGTVIATQKGNEMEYDIVQPVAWDFIDATEQLLDKVSQASYFVCGSLAARSELSRNTLYQLLHVAQTKVIDINLRPPHFERDTLEHLFQQADILKLNDHELAMIAGWYINEPDFEKQVIFLSDQFSIPTIIITRGANGAALYYNNAFYYHNGYKVTVADTIGSGDAFLAGFLSKHIQQNNAPESSLDFACKLGAFVASQKGACPPYNASEVDQLIS
ncbi:carbohydrate kinase family protein [Niabella hibiscisoli]|uniref:carbohydrate kinase family protein n=1 Tax=Niabella hibiscisoli TaxID=1825928 RepID=UPI001F0EC73B|nr:carbohydrate kinase [Niabella hibiscisoli]MCH5715261.1 carbohydrate kinase [Niabella hibiscisoli]